MDRKILIYGAGGAGRELAFALSLDKNPDTAWKVQGFIDDTKWVGDLVNNISVLGGFDYLENYSGDIAVTIVDNPSTRRDLILRINPKSRLGQPHRIHSKEEQCHEESTCLSCRSFGHPFVGITYSGR